MTCSSQRQLHVFEKLRLDFSLQNQLDRLTGERVKKEENC